VLWWSVQQVSRFSPDDWAGVDELLHHVEFIDPVA